ncbi:MAG: sulfurtransferase TusA family protein [Emcibacter sp.]|nr:sulfurtransferase TusA family protein [Emcibacter sp.]
MDKGIFSEELDVTGHRCPVPVLRVRRRLESMPPTTILKILATDPMTQIDFPHFCQESGHELLEMTEVNTVFHFLIKKAGE